RPQHPVHDNRQAQEFPLRGPRKTTLARKSPLVRAEKCSARCSTNLEETVALRTRFRVGFRSKETSAKHHNIEQSRQVRGRMRPQATVPDGLNRWVLGAMVPGKGTRLNACRCISAGRLPRELGVGFDSHHCSENQNKSLNCGLTPIGLQL